MAHIYKRYKTDGSPRYVVRYRDADGRWTERVAGATRKAAEILKNRLECEVAEGAVIKAKDSDPYFKDYIVDFCKAKKELVKPSTYEDYCRVIKNHFLPYFGHMSLSQITPLRIQDFIFYLDEKGLSLESKRKVLRYLNNILRTAWLWELLDRDPTLVINWPRKARSEMDFLTPQEIAKLLAVARGEMHALLSVACLAGLRQGEILGLKWRDIDFGGRTIKVVRSYNPNHGFGPPKTDSARRAVPMIPTLAETLMEHYLSRRPEDFGELVFQNSNGNPKDRTNLTNREFKRVLRRAGLRMIRFHDLRHSYASLCINAGMDPKALQRAMGHASVRTTFDIYAHLLPSSYGNVVERIEAIIKGKDNYEMVS